MLDNDILKNYFQNKQYNKCIELLKNKIASFVINQIQQKDSSIEFTTISDLISTSEFYLNDNSVATALFYSLKQDDELKQIELLLSICENNNIK